MQKHAVKNSGLRPDRGYIGHKAAKMMKRSKSIEKRQADAIEEKTKLLKNLEKSDDLKIAQLAYHTNSFVSLTGLSIAYGEKSVCHDIRFTIEKGDRIALSGKNGSGKSSIIKLIYGENIPFTGSFEKSSRLKISYVSQDTSFLQGGLTEYTSENDIDESLFKAILHKIGYFTGPV
jgi:lincosamide and streptogramin A transport system ATP-binding/permease protein